jgi:hypothetical protein
VRSRPPLERSREGREDAFAAARLAWARALAAADDDLEEDPDDDLDEDAYVAADEGLDGASSEEDAEVAAVVGTSVEDEDWQAEEEDEDADSGSEGGGRARGRPRRKRRRRPVFRDEGEAETGSEGEDGEDGAQPRFAEYGYPPDAPIYTPAGPATGPWSRASHSTATASGDGSSRSYDQSATDSVSSYARASVRSAPISLATPASRSSYALAGDDSSTASEDEGDYEEGIIGHATYNPLFTSLIPRKREINYLNPSTKRQRLTDSAREWEDSVAHFKEFRRANAHSNKLHAS